MCGITGYWARRGDPSPGSRTSGLRGEAASSAARRQRRLGAARRARGARPHAPLDPRPLAARPPADALGGRAAVDGLQRRGLQLRDVRARTRGAGPPLPQHRRLRGDPRGLPAVGVEARWTSSSACSPSRSGTRASAGSCCCATAWASSRSTTRGTAAALVRLGAQGAARLRRVAPRDRPRRRSANTCSSATSPRRAPSTGTSRKLLPGHLARAGRGRRAGARTATGRRRPAPTRFGKRSPRQELERQLEALLRGCVPLSHGVRRAGGRVPLRRHRLVARGGAPAALRRRRVRTFTIGFDDAALRRVAHAKRVAAAPRHAPHRADRHREGHGGRAHALGRSLRRAVRRHARACRPTSCRSWRAST